MSKERRSKKLKFGIVASEFNSNITSGLLKGALSYLKESGITDENIKLIKCPGALEIPMVAKKLCKKGNVDAVICLGAVIKGETAHFEYISHFAAYGISQLNLDQNIPVSFGILTCYTEEQAIARSLDNEENKGREAAKAAFDMIKILRSI